MNRAWMLRAEERIARLERVVAELKERVAELEAQPEVTDDAPVKRGPGRPRKTESLPA